MGEHVSLLVAQADAGGGFLQMALMIGGMFAVMYFVMIRPERKKQTEHSTFLSSLKRGDEVVLTSGIIGKVQSVEERTLTIEIADKVKIKVLKIAVTGPAQRFLAVAAEGDKVPKKEEDAAASEKEKQKETQKA